MKIGLHVNAITYRDKSWREVCERAGEAGIKTIEPGSGGFVGRNHCDPRALLDHPDLLGKFADVLEKNGLSISAFSCHGNPLHPDVKIAQAHEADIDASVDLAARLGVPTVNCFAGCPGLDGDARFPAWVTIRWPEEFERGLAWQWEKRIIPFWEKKVRRARDAGIRFGFEMHPGDSIFNPAALLRLREALNAGEICCNLDPSHLFWQGIDPIIVIEKLSHIIVHVHMKDTKINQSVMRFKGGLSEPLFGDLDERAWTFRVVGEGHDEGFWRRFIAALRSVRYDGVLSIEHEDPYIPTDEGILQAVKYLNRLLAPE